MALNTKPTKHAWYPSGETLTEQEHKNSCDVNLMLKAAARGQAIATRPIGQWDDRGVDDMNMSRLDILVQKQQLEEDLASYSQQDKELDQALFDAIPAAIREKFDFTLKKQSKAGLKNDDLNDEKQPVQKTKLKKAKTPDPDPAENDEVENS